MNGAGFPKHSQSDDIGTVTDWLIILLVYFVVVACLIVPIAIEARAKAAGTGAALSSATAIETADSAASPAVIRAL